VIDATTGEVTAKKNIDAGYDDTVCIKCSNTLFTFEQDSLNVKQLPNCGVSLTA
jgi:hypothetical protein